MSSLSEAESTANAAQSSTKAKAQTVRTHVAGQVDQTSNDVTLDFVAADINDVLKALAVQTGANIVSSADVRGTITVSLAHVTLEQALDMVARLSGYQYAKANNAYIIGTPAGIASFAAPALNNAEPPLTEVVTTHYASMDDITSLVKLRYPDLQVSTGTAISGTKVGSSENAVVLSGPTSEVTAAKQLIDSFESNLAARVAEETTQIYTVHYASEGDLINIVNSLVPSVVITPGPGLGFQTSAPSASSASASSSASPVSSGGGGGAAPSATGSSSASSTGSSTLLLTGTQPTSRRPWISLAKIDTKPVQLMFETKVTEINDQDEKDIGLNWNFDWREREALANSLQLDIRSARRSTRCRIPATSQSSANLDGLRCINAATVSLDALFTIGPRQAAL